MKIQILWSPFSLVWLCSSSFITIWISLFLLSSKSSAWLQKVCTSLQTLRVAAGRLILRHGVTIAPTMQRNQQPVSQDLLAWVFWEFQHVDTVEEKRKKNIHRAGGGVLMSHACPRERPAAIWITCCKFCHKETSPCFQTVISVRGHHYQLHWRDILPSSAYAPQLRCVEYTYWVCISSFFKFITIYHHSPLNLGTGNN